MGGIDAAAQEMLVGAHGCPALCAAFYLVWWWLFFNPRLAKPEGARYAFGVACIVAAAILGVAGVALAASALGSLSAVSTGAPGWAFIIGAVVGYLLLAVFTVKVFARPVTTELILFVAWAALEFAVINTLYGAGAWPIPATFALAALVAVVLAASLVCYVLYYRLGPMPSFIDGAIPLVAVGITALVMVCAIAVCGAAA